MSILAGSFLPWSSFHTSNTVVLNPGLIEPQMFGESVSGVWWQENWAIEVKKNSRHAFYFSNYEGIDESWKHVWNLWDSVPPTRLRTTAPTCNACQCVTMVQFSYLQHIITDSVLAWPNFHTNILWLTVSYRGPVFPRS